MIQVARARLGRTWPLVALGCVVMLSIMAVATARIGAGSTARALRQDTGNGTDATFRSDGALARITSEQNLSVQIQLGLIVTRCEGLPISVQFNSTVSDGSPPISYSWNPGDGSGVVHSASLNHNYSNAGNFEVSLRVADSHGNTANTSYALQLNRPSCVAAPFPQSPSPRDSAADGLIVPVVIGCLLLGTGFGAFLLVRRRKKTPPRSP
jgi:hypothetical protein